MGDHYRQWSTRESYAGPALSRRQLLKLVSVVSIGSIVAACAPSTPQALVVAEQPSPPPSATSPVAAASSPVPPNTETPLSTPTPSKEPTRTPFPSTAEATNTAVSPTNTPKPTATTEPAVKSLEDMGLESKWTSPANTDVCNTCKAVDKAAIWHNGWDYEHHDGAGYSIVNDPERGPVIKYTIQAKQPSVRAQLDAYGEPLVGNVAVRIAVKFGKDYKVETRDGTANFLTTNLADPNPGHGAPPNTWYLLGNVDMDQNRTLQLFTFRPYVPAEQQTKTTYKSNITLEPDTWYDIELRAYNADKSLQVLLDGKVVKFTGIGTAANLRGVTRVPLHPDVKQVQLTDLHGGAYGYGMRWSPQDRENWILNGPISIFQW